MAFKSEQVLAVLISRNWNIDFTGREEQVRQICALACVETAGVNYSAKYKDDIIEFSNGTLEMPWDCLIVKDVRRMDGTEINYNIVSNTNVSIQNYTSGKVRVDWWGVPKDDKGFPPITQKQINYCVAYIEWLIMRERLIENKLGLGVYDRFVNDKDDAFRAAKNTTPSKQQMNRALWMSRNGQFYRNPNILNAYRPGRKF